MKIHRITAGELTPDLAAAWCAIQREVPYLNSPFLRPEFAQAMHRVGAGVEIGILEAEGVPVGFFPYSRGRRVARAVGRDLGEWEGVVIPPDVPWDPLEVLRGCGLTAWHFNRVPVEQTPLAAYHSVVREASYVDLADGAEGYYARLDDSARRQVSDARRRRRKVERELGAVRFEPVCADADVLQQLVDWKREQCRRTGVADVFTLPWVVPLLQDTITRATPEFGGMLSALYQGDRLAGVQFGLRSRDILGGIFTVYDNALAKYGPGLMLIYEMIDAAATLGIRRIEMGVYTPAYKANLMSGARMLAEGAVDRRFVAAALHRGWLHTRDWLRRSALRGAAHRVNRMLTTTRSWLGIHG